MTFHLRISFFSRFLGGETPISNDVVDLYEQIKYYFITNFYTYESIVNLQLFLRLSFKMDWQYTDTISPLELSKLARMANEFEEEKKKELEQAANKK